MPVEHDRHTHAHSNPSSSFAAPHLGSLTPQIRRRLRRQRGDVAAREALSGLRLGQLLHVVGIRGQDDIGGAGGSIRGLVFVFRGGGPEVLYGRQLYALHREQPLGLCEG